MSQEKIPLPKQFIIGAASSAWQTEGWSGKKENQDSYMDLWYKEAHQVWHEGYGPAVATDLYNRYPEDVQLMKQIGLTHYRTSINWARFLTDYETGTVDEDYAQYIDNFLDAMIEVGVQPMLCLEHYELPAYLQQKYGGWGSKDVVELFVLYAEKVFERYAHKISYWFTFNEPIVVQTRIYLDAIRYPYEQNSKKWMQWNFNKALASARVVKLYHDKNYASSKQLIVKGKIGIILNPEVTYPRSSASHDVKAAEIYDLFFNRVFLDPAVKGFYPSELMDLLYKHDIQFEATLDELSVIKENTVDFLGANLYYPHRVKAPSHAWNSETPFHPAMYYDNFELPGRKMNFSRGWEIDPHIMYDMAIRLKNDYNNIEWILTENGMGIENELRFKDSNGVIQDEYRIQFIAEHIYWLLKAIEEGANCQGYMLWAFTDNVSPMNAFKNRYGLVEIDLEKNRARRLKKSAYWYQELSETRVLDIHINNEYK